MSSYLHQVLAVYGFVRHISDDTSLVIPLEIHDLIYCFFKYLEFAWDTEKFKKYEIISGNNSPFERGSIKTTINAYSICASKNVISSDLYDQFYFEIQIDSCDHVVALMIGFIKYPILEAIITNHNGHKVTSYLGNKYPGNQWGLQVHQSWKHVYNVYNGHHGSVTLPVKKEHETKHKIGDKFGFEIDFTKRQCKAFKNGREIGTMANDIPLQIVVAVSVFNGSVSCTKFEPIKTTSRKY